MELGGSSCNQNKNQDSASLNSPLICVPPYDCSKIDAIYRTCSAQHKQFRFIYSCACNSKNIFRQVANDGKVNGVAEVTVNKFFS